MATISYMWKRRELLHVLAAAGTTSVTGVSMGTNVGTAVAGAPNQGTVPVSSGATVKIACLDAEAKENFNLAFNNRVVLREERTFVELV